MEHQVQAKSWAEEFQQSHGRPPRVLHIGNIANNAYTNARIQRRFGIEADVICYDYYHVMGCPEWEDAPFTGEVDNFFPDWWSTSLKGWSRPDWFVQGPVDLCISYLLAKQTGDKVSKELAWKRLEGNYWNLLQAKSKEAGRERPSPPAHLRSFIYKYPSVATRVLTKLGMGRHIEPAARFRDKLLRLFRKSQFDQSAALPEALTNSVMIASPGQPRVVQDPVLRSPEECQLASQALAEHIALSFADFDESPRLNAMVLATVVATKFAPILSNYDVIQGYSIDGFIPLANGFRNYTCYEHGTLRDIPFGHDFNGIVTNYAYRNAAFSFVTNCDVLPSVKRMGLEPKRVVYLPHAFDERRITAFESANPDLVPPPDRTVFFSPSRHHWVSEPRSMQKGNDHFIRAAAEAAKKDRNFEIIFVRWGVDIEATERLLAELGISDLVRWIEPLKKGELWTAYRTAHAIVDQFATPAIGGVCFEAMALGRRVITWVDDDVMRTFFGEEPPCYSAYSVETCYRQITRVLKDPADMAGAGEAARQWMQTYHSSQRIVTLQTAAYRHVVDGKAAKSGFTIDRNLWSPVPG